MSTNPKTRRTDVREDAVVQDHRPRDQDPHRADGPGADPDAGDQSGRIARLLEIYNGIKPLLTGISALPLIPSGWRAALVLFNNALAAVAAGADDVSADFKAGKDL